jgi:hypothetical protein
LVADAGGLSVRNFVHKYAVPWSSVEGFSATDRELVIIRLGADPVNVHAVRSMNPSLRPSSVAATLESLRVGARGVDRIPGEFLVLGDAPTVDGSSTRGDEGQDGVGAAPGPAVASRRRRRRRWILQAVGIVVIGIAAGVADSLTGTGQPSSSVSVPSLWDVTFQVTGSSHSANVRYTMWDTGSFATGPNDVDIPELTPFVTQSFPYFVHSPHPPGSHVVIEVRNNLPTGDVGCTIDYGLGSGPRTQTHAHGPSVARCDVYLK